MSNTVRAAILLAALNTLAACQTPHQAGQKAQAATADCFYDSHAHLVADDIVHYPRNPMQLSGARGTPGVAGIPGGSASTVHEVPDVSRMLVWMRDEHVCAIAAVQKGAIYQFDNAYVVDSAEKLPDVMRAVIIIDPENPDTPKLMRTLAARGIVGARFFGTRGQRTSQYLTSPGAQEVWKTADELGLVVDIEAPSKDGASMIPTIVDLAQRYPQVTIVLDHLFMPDVTAANFGLDGTYLTLVPQKNVYFKFTTLSMDAIREAGVSSKAVLRRAVDLYGADRVMWGSDIGTSAGTYHEMVSRALEACTVLSAAERSAVMYETGRRVFAKRK